MNTIFFSSEIVLVQALRLLAILRIFRLWLTHDSSLSILIPDPNMSVYTQTYLTLTQMNARFAPPFLTYNFLASPNHTITSAEFKSQFRLYSVCCSANPAISWGERGKGGGRLWGREMGKIEKRERGIMKRKTCFKTITEIHNKYRQNLVYEQGKCQRNEAKKKERKNK